MGLCRELSCEAGSFSHRCNPHRFLQQEVLRLYFPTLEPWVEWSVSLPSCSFWFICTQMWDCPPAATLLCILAPPSIPHPRLPFPVPPTYLDACFLFNSLVFGLAYSSTFWQFQFLNLLLSFFWLCEEAQCISLCFRLGQKADYVEII